MRISKIYISNFRQYKLCEIEFCNNKTNDLHVLIGKNGSGKTNILNAINWCLYDDEPHLSKISEGLHIINMKKQEDLKEGEIACVLVKLFAENESKESIAFTRESKFQKKGNRFTKIENCFSVLFLDDKGNTKKIEKSEDANFFVNRFVPKNIREFFFFDGERLNNYFIETTGQKIKNAVFDISQTNLLDNVSGRLEKIIDDLRRSAGRNNPDIEKANNLYIEEDKIAIGLENEINGQEVQISIAKHNIEKYRAELDNTPKVEVLSKEREELIIKLEKYDFLGKQKQEERRSVLFNYIKRSMLLDANKHTLGIINNKRINNELPPTVDKKLVEESVNSGKCGLCDNNLSAEKKEELKKELKKLTISQSVASELYKIEPIIEKAIADTKMLSKKLKSLQTEIDNYKSEYEKYEKQKNKINTMLDGYDVDEVREKYRELRKYEEMRDQNQRKCGQLSGQLKLVEQKREEYNKKMKIEIEKDERIKEINKRIDFCVLSEGICLSTKAFIKKSIRKKIQEETQTLFFNLVWKKRSFSKVEIDERYNMHLMHFNGQECLGTVSAGERGLLALAFTLALHKVSGFNAPIIIDTPVARISDVNRENIAKTFANICSNKQLILLFTPAEYSEEVSGKLEKVLKRKMLINISETEQEACVEVIKNG